MRAGYYGTTECNVMTSYAHNLPMHSENTFCIYVIAVYHDVKFSI